jgi:hypothetical protein
MSDIADLEELLDAGPNAPPSPPRGSSADHLTNKRSTNLTGWSPRLNPDSSAETSAAEMLPSISLGAASLAVGGDGTKSNSLSSSSATMRTTHDTTTNTNANSVLGTSFKSATLGLATADPAAETKAVTAAEKKALKQAEKKARAAAFVAANPNKVKGAKGKKPKLTKAERRAKQEAQRAAKAANTSKGKGGTTKGSSSTSNETKPSSSSSSSSSTTTSSNSGDPGTANSPTLSTSNSLFSHLSPYQSTLLPKRTSRFSSRDNVHPSFARVGLKFAQGLIVGGNNRCVALLEAVKDVIADYSPPPNSSLSRTLNDHLKPMIHYVVSVPFFCVCLDVFKCFQMFSNISFLSKCPGNLMPIVGCFFPSISGTMPTLVNINGQWHSFHQTIDFLHP